MHVSIIDRRALVGGLTEIQVRLDDEDTGRFRLLGARGAFTPVRVTLLDNHRPFSSAMQHPEGAIEIRDKWIYVNTPVCDGFLSVIVGPPYTGLGFIREGISLEAQRLTLIERLGEIALDLPMGLDEGTFLNENPLDAQRESARRRTTE